jgi:hypothetical protein
MSSGVEDVKEDTAPQRKRDFHVSVLSHLESSKPGVCVYLDPEKMRLDGELDFTSETRSIVPSSSQRAL